MDPERRAATDYDALGRERDVADIDLDGPALRGGGLVTGEVLRTDREGVGPRGKRPAAGRPGPLDPALRFRRSAEDDQTPAEVDESVRVLAEAVLDRDGAARPGEEDAVGLASGRREHLGRRRVEGDVVREAARPARVREVDPGVVHAVRSQGAISRTTVPVEVLGSVGSHALVRGDGGD